MNIPDPKTLGELIRKHRKAMGLTQRNAAGLCGVGERFLSELENGKESAHLGKSFQVIRRLGLRVAIKGNTPSFQTIDERT